MKRSAHSVRQAAFLLALLSAGTALLSCQNPAEKKQPENSVSSETAELQAETENLTELERRQRTPDNLPEKDFGGKEYRVIIEGPRSDEFYTEAQNGDSCNDALFMRNSKIESRFHFHLSILPQTDRHAVADFLQKMVLAGDNDAELAAYNDYIAYKPVDAGVCQNWLDIPHVDVTQPWHNQLANDSATVNGKLFSICSDLSVSSMTYTYAMFFNTRLTDNYDLPAESIYQMVRDGTWTIDKFIAITKDLYEDTNGNGKNDPKDLHGFGYYICNPADVWLTAFDQPLIKSNPDGTSLEVVFLSEKTESALAKMRDYQKTSEGFTKYKTIYDEEPSFANGLLVFAPLRFSAAFQALREMQDSYAIIPYPKWDEAQEHYYTNADDKFLVFSVPKTVTDTEFAGVVFEALSAESYRNVYPVYYDSALKGKYSSDPTTADMIDLIMSGRKFDFSFQFGVEHLMGLPYMFRDLLVSPKKSLASHYASIEQELHENVADIYALFDDTE